MSVRFSDVLVGLGAVCRFHVFGVVFEFFADAIGDQSEHIVLYERTGIIEIAESGFAGLAADDPLPVMAGRRGYQLLRLGRMILRHIIR